LKGLPIGQGATADEVFASAAFSKIADSVILALRFVWAAQRQINRFANGFYERPTLRVDRSRRIFPPLDLERTYEEYRAEAYVAAVAAHQASKWLKVAGRDLKRASEFRFDAVLEKQIEAARDIYEHWDTQREDFLAKRPPMKAGKKFLAHHPGQDWPGDRWRSDSTGTWLDNLNLDRLYEELLAREELRVTAYEDLLGSAGWHAELGNYAPRPSALRPVKSTSKRPT
jgi:hypothetical protein